MEYSDVLKYVEMRYGKEEKVVGKWEEIVSIESDEERNKKIDELLVVLEKNKDTNGFFSSSDSISIDVFARFKLDDKEIYYLLFKNLREIIINDNGKVQDKRNLMVIAINKTVEEYFGKIDSTKKEERLEINTIEEDDITKATSIKCQKGKQTAECSERSSVVHNAWLLFGETSYWVNSNDFYIDHNADPGCAHAFSIVSIEKKVDGETNIVSAIHDTTLDIWARLPQDFLQMIKNGNAIDISDKKLGRVVYIGARKLISSYTH